MLDDKVHGLQATSMTLNERFTMLVASAPDHSVMKPRRKPIRQNLGNYFYHNNRNNNLVEQIARRLQWQAKQQALRNRLGLPQRGMRRYGSETSLGGRMWRSNSFGNLSQGSVRNRVYWRQSNGNLNRSASFSNLQSGGAWRQLRYRRRGARPFRGKFRGGRVGFQNGARARGAGGAPGAVRGAGGARGGRGQRGRGRGGMQNRGMQTRAMAKAVPTKEELDNQIDEYMANTKSALDRDLDTYMKNAMELE